MNDDGDRQSFDHPVAYDADGRPLYAHPVPTGDEPQHSIAPAPPSTPTVVHVARSIDPTPVEISPEIQARHEESVQQYSQLDLSDHEYVILNVHRHPIGLAFSLTITLILTCFIVASMILLPELRQMFSQLTVDTRIVVGGAMIVLGCLWLCMYILYWVYGRNSFFLTNESIIENTQLSLFSSNVTSVGLGDVVDVSYRQVGMIEQAFNYGTVQVGTKDDEVPYVFTLVRDPKNQASVLKEAVEAFKSGRPISIR